MSQSGTRADAEMTAMLEQLACGELDDAKRSAVLSWLEKDPRRWRICGLAFLEAQSWSEAMGDWPTAPNEQVTIRLAAAAPSPDPRRRSVTALVSAACLLAAFVLGAMWDDVAGQGVAPLQAARDFDHGFSNNATSLDQPVLASLTVQQGSAYGPASSIQIPVVPRGAASESEAPSLNAIPEYIRRQWERRGFKLTAERRYLFANLSNGQPIVVPIDQVLVDSVPQTIN